MFNKTAPVIEPAPVEVATTVATDLVPLSHLSLDVDEPSVGWDVYLAGRNIPVVVDHVGRFAISAADAKQLLDEQHANEVRKREAAERNEQRLIEQDRVRRESIWTGLHWTQLPDGVAPAAAMLQSAHDARPRRTSVLQEALSNSDTLTFHSLRDEAEAS